MTEMKLRELRLKVEHPYAYQPHGCVSMTVTGIFWDENNQRICLQVTYDNRYVDFIPLSDVENHHYEVLV